MKVTGRILGGWLPAVVILVVGPWLVAAQQTDDEARTSASAVTTPDQAAELAPKYTGFDDTTHASIGASVRAVSEDWPHAGDSVSGELTLTDTLFASTLADLNPAFTSDLNVTQSVQAWLSPEHENYGLVVRLLDDVGGTLSFQSAPGAPGLSEGILSQAVVNEAGRLTGPQT